MVSVVLPIFICWHLWVARNKAKFEGVSISALSVIQQVSGLWHHTLEAFRPKVNDDHYKAQLLRNAGCSLKSRLQRHFFLAWNRPLQGELKLHVDGASKGGTGLYGGGGGLRKS